MVLAISLHGIRLIVCVCVCVYVCVCVCVCVPSSLPRVVVACSFQMIWPHQSGETVVQSYNCILSMAHAYEV